jgi:ABC-type lipoprotein release transport system permease subunit
MTSYSIAWRNLWRNRRRTLITTASVFFGVWLAILMSSMQEGSYSNMIGNIVKFYSGYIQVQDQEYWDDKTLYNAFEANHDLLDSIHRVPGVQLANPRLESFALASSNEVTQPVMVVGIDPQTEDSLTGLSGRIREGRYLEASDHGTILGGDLARHLQVTTGDTLALLGQGYYGNTVAQLFPVRGILELSNPALNKQFAYLSLPAAQDYYSANGMLTSIAIMVGNYSDVKPVMENLKSFILPPYTVMSWDEMQPELMQMIESDRAGGVVMIGILYMIIAFGILGTLMMMMAERRRELGVMVAVGMQKTRLAVILFWETFYIGMLGVLAGLLFSIPLIALFVNHPIPLSGDSAQIMKDFGIEPVLIFSAMPSIFLKQVITVFIMTLVLSAYPVVGSLKLKLVKALRS